jgi:hypothetical protein
MLITAMRNISNKTLLKHQKDRDGILAWIELRRDYDYDGSEKLRLEYLEEIIHKPYDSSSPEGLAGYIDKFMAALNEVEIIQEEDYPEKFKKRFLLAGIRGLQGAAHLVQTCRDHPEWTFEAITTYLRENSKNIESQPQHRKRVMASYSEETPVPALSYLTFNETVDLFEKHAEQVGAFAAYQSFNSNPMRESLRIHPDIWKQLGPEIQEKISKMKADLYAKRSAAAQANPPPAEKGSNPAFKGSIPSQYPSMKKANKVDTVEMERQAMAALCEKLGELTSMDTEGDTDDEELHRNAFTTMTRFSEEESEGESEEPILIRANTQIAIDDAKHYAISDSGADSSILGKYTHVTAYTGRYAYLVGYDPNTTRSSKIPVVSGYIKVKAHNDIPVILEVHEALFYDKNPITLISEYQARDYGTIIDSVSTRHKTIAGTYGTQRMIISPDLHVPLVDRGGLMGFEVLPWKKGDEERFEIIPITSDAKWTPRRYLQSLEDPNPLTPVIPDYDSLLLKTKSDDDPQETVKDVADSTSATKPHDTVHNLTDYVDDGKFDEWIKSFENYDKELTYQELASLIGIQVPDNTQEELCPDSAEDINQWGETIETNSVC